MSVSEKLPPLYNISGFANGIIGNALDFSCLVYDTPRDSAQKLMCKWTVVGRHAIDGKDESQQADEPVGSGVSHDSK